MKLNYQLISRLKNIKKPKALLLFTLMIGVGFFIFTAKASAQYLQNELIDDPVFLNAASMTQSQLQSFLVGKGSYLASYYVTETQSDYPNYNQSVLASQDIYDAAQVYGINPQVILATLQKEQSLVTDPNPVQSQLDFAMGYGCADSTGCSAYSGFFNQVDNGTWQLRLNYERARGNDTWWDSDIAYPCANPPAPPNESYYYPGLFPGNSVTFYDDYGNAYDTFTIANASTASLYCYTPHAYPGSSEEYYSGSYYFDTSFEDWFGSPLDSYALVKSSTSPNIYLLDGSTETLYYIPSYNVMAAYGLSSMTVDTIDPTALADFTVGGTLSTVVQQASTGNIYLVNNGIKYYVNANDCTNWGLQCFNSNDVMSLSDPLINSLSNGGELPAAQDYNGVVYLMQNGYREPVISSTELNALGYSWSNVVPMSSINSTQPLGPIQIPNGSVIEFQSSDNVYLYDNNTYTLIPDPNLISAWGLASSIISNPPTSSYDTTAPVTSGALSNFASSGSNTYFVDQGIKMNITPISSNWTNGSTNITTNAPTALGNLPSEATTPIIISSTGNIYVMQNGYARYVPTFSDFYGLGLSTSELTHISSYGASTLPQGNIYLSDGTLFQIAGNPNIYLVNNQSALLVSSPNDFSYFNFNWGNVEELASSVLTAYPDTDSDSNGVLSVVVENNTNQLYTVNDGIAYALTPSIISAWGLGSVVATYLSSQNLLKLQTGPTMTVFARTPNGVIYYGQGGAAHPISNYSEFLSLGGNQNNTINVPSDFIALCPVGSTM